MRIELELTSPGDLLVDLSRLAPSKIFSRPLKEIEKQAVFVANHPYALGEHFKLTQVEGGADELVLLGQTRRIISAGCQMEAGRLVIMGEAGPFTGAEMSGGELEVFGEAGDCLGVGMSGGTVRVHGSAGNWCGAALPGRAKGMTGGTIIVEGNVGVESGRGMRRGLMVIGGDSGAYLGVHMVAGTIFCLGRLGAGAGLEMKRGSLVAGSSATLLPGFLPAGEADTEWLRLYLVAARRFGFPQQHPWEKQLPKRFTGDHFVTGRGEVLIYDILE